MEHKDELGVAVAVPDAPATPVAVTAVMDARGMEAAIGQYRAIQAALDKWARGLKHPKNIRDWVKTEDIMEVIWQAINS